MSFVGMQETFMLFQCELHWQLSNASISPDKFKSLNAFQNLPLIELGSTISGFKTWCQFFLDLKCALFEGIWELH